MEVVGVKVGNGCGCGRIGCTEEKVVVVVVEGAPVGEQGGEKGDDANVEKGGCADHGLPCGSTQQPLEAPAGLRL